MGSTPHTTCLQRWQHNLIMDGSVSDDDVNQCQFCEFYNAIHKCVKSKLFHCPLMLMQARSTPKGEDKEMIIH